MDGEASYYGVLNVPPTASEGEIRRAYRHLAQVFHPDKHASQELREKAAEGFAVINEAYEVLSNAQKRQVYDIYGKAGLKAGLDVGTKLKSVDELKAQWEKFRAQQGMDSAEGDSPINTLVHCDVNASGMFVEAPFSDGWYPQTKTCWVHSILTQPVGNMGQVWTGGQLIVNSKGEGGGCLLGGFRTGITPESTLEVTGTWGVKTALVVSSTQQITTNSMGTMTGSYSMQEGPGLQFSTSRILSGESRAQISLGLGPPSEVGATLSVSTRPSTATSLSGKIQVGPVYSISGKGTYAVNEETTARAAAKFGWTGIEVDLGVIQQISPTSRMSVSVAVGLQGTTLRVKWHRPSLQVDIPIILTRDFEEWKIALAAYTVPPLLLCFVRHFIILPIIRKVEAREALLMRQKHSDAIKRQLRSASAAQNLIAPVARKQMSQEISCNGLIIVHAEYGVLDRQPMMNFDREGPSSPSSDLPPAKMDVTIAVQHLVNGSEVIFHNDVAKSGLMGFCDLAPSQDKSLLMYYVWNGRPYTAEVADTAALRLPAQGSLVVDLTEAEDILRLASDLGCEEASGSSAQINGQLNGSQVVAAQQHYLLPHCWRTTMNQFGVRSATASTFFSLHNPSPVSLAQKPFPRQSHCAASCQGGASRHAPDRSNRSSFLRVCLLSTFGASFTGAGQNSSVHAATRTSMEQVLDNPKWPEEFPYKPEDFGRFDESPDTFFYSAPRYVTHIDDGAISALTKYYSEVFPPSGTKDVAILDICSSWISHYPQGYKQSKIAGLGMNQEELQRNPALTEYNVQDLNASPVMPYEDNSFDVITNAVSVDYLNKPLEVFKEMHRCLKPGGLAAMSFSNRCFPTKAISIWTSTGDQEHVWIVGSYFHYSVPGGFEEPQCKNISPSKGLFGQGDPMYVVYARKK